MAPGGGQTARAISAVRLKLGSEGLEYFRFRTSKQFVKGPGRFKPSTVEDYRRPRECSLLDALPTDRAPPSSDRSNGCPSSPPFSSRPIPREPPWESILDSFRHSGPIHGPITPPHCTTIDEKMCRTTRALPWADMWLPLWGEQRSRTNNRGEPRTHTRRRSYARRRSIASDLCRATRASVAGKDAHKRFAPRRDDAPTVTTILSHPVAHPNCRFSRLVSETIGTCPLRFQVGIAVSRN